MSDSDLKQNKEEKEIVLEDGDGDEEVAEEVELVEDELEEVRKHDVWEERSEK